MVFLKAPGGGSSEDSTTVRGPAGNVIGGTPATGSSFQGYGYLDSQGNVQYNPNPVTVSGGGAYDSVTGAQLSTYGDPAPTASPPAGPPTNSVTGNPPATTAAGGIATMGTGCNFCDGVSSWFAGLDPTTSYLVMGIAAVAIIVIVLVLL